MGRGRSVLLTVLLSLLVATGAVGASAYLRIKQQNAAAEPPSASSPAPPQGPVTCHVEPCSVMVATAVAGTRIELIADAGGQSGRLRVGDDDRLIESTITTRGAVLTPKSLHCAVGTLSACMIRGEVDGNIIGEVVVGRSGKWNATAPRYIATGGYLSLGNVLGDGAPEVIAAQRGYFAQVFTLDGNEVGCTAVVTKPDKLPGWPTVHPAESQLRKPCP